MCVFARKMQEQARVRYIFTDSHHILVNSDLQIWKFYELQQKILKKAIRQGNYVLTQCLAHHMHKISQSNRNMIAKRGWNIKRSKYALICDTTGDSLRTHFYDCSGMYMEEKFDKMKEAGLPRATCLKDVFEHPNRELYLNFSMIPVYSLLREILIEQSMKNCKMDIFLWYYERIPDLVIERVSYTNGIAAIIEQRDWKFAFLLWEITGKGKIYLKHILRAAIDDEAIYVIRSKSELLTKKQIRSLINYSMSADATEYLKSLL